MSQLSEKLNKAIKEGKLHIKPRWHFLLKHWVIGGLVLLTVLIGALAFSITWYLLNDFDWLDYKYLEMGMLEYVIFGLPYFWMMIILLLTGIAYYNFRQTKHGYRYHWYWVVLGVIVLSVALGTSLEAFGLGEKIDDQLVYNIPQYERMVPRRSLMWQQPHKGMLGGAVQAWETERILMLDRNGQLWEVMLTAETEIAPGAEASPMIKVLGEKDDEWVIIAKIILPARPGLLKTRQEMPPFNFMNRGELPPHEINMPGFSY